MPLLAPLETARVAEPWLSVLMPTYNGARYLGAALESIGVQDAQDLEVIVVDDGSTDETLAIVEAFSHRLSLRRIETPRTGNWVANTNRAIAAARGPYLTCLHQDDCWLPGRLASVRRALAHHGDVALVVHPARFIDASGRWLGTWRCPLPKTGGLVEADVLVGRLLVQNFLAMPSPVFRRDAFEQVGGFDEDLWYTADWDLWLKLASLGQSLYLPEPLAGFRIHPLSQTISRSADTVEFRRQLEVVLRRHLPRRQGAGCRDGGRLARVAQFSVDVNTALAATSHGERPRLGILAVQGLLLGPLGWHQYWRDSRIGERVCSRIRLRKEPVA
jgi:glycosyltransferase involved in cell wall biosynthesis